MEFARVSRLVGTLVCVAFVVSCQQSNQTESDPNGLWNFGKDDPKAAGEESSAWDEFAQRLVRAQRNFNLFPVKNGTQILDTQDISDIADIDGIRLFKKRNSGKFGFEHPGLVFTTDVVNNRLSRVAMDDILDLSLVEENRILVDELVKLLNDPRLSIIDLPGYEVHMALKLGHQEVVLRHFNSDANNLHLEFSDGTWDYSLDFIKRKNSKVSAKQLKEATLFIKAMRTL